MRLNNFRRLRLLGPLLLLIIAGFKLAPDDELVRQIVGRLQSFYIGSFPEKSYLHTDKALYAIGETIWLKAYVVDGASHRPDTVSRVLYVDLVGPDQSVVAQRVLRLTNGTAAADFSLADTLAQGMYTVRAYTNWMRNFSPDYFFSKRLPVWQVPTDASAGATAAAPRRAARPASRKPAPTAKTDVQFFPEGGNLVAGLPMVVAFKATDGYGRGVAVSGQLIDDQGQAVASFKTLHAGMGTLLLTPQAGRQYKAAVVLPDGSRAEYALPAVAAAGFVLKVTQTKDFVFVGVQRQAAAGAAAASEAVTLVAHVRGTVAYAATGQLTGSEGYAARIPRAKFPTGVAHFTLFDGQGTAQCERLAFINATPGLQVSITPDKATYAPREKVNLTVAVTDGAGQPVAAQLSLAVTNALEAAQEPETTILTHLLLTSDLQGYVENPGYYFQSKTPDREQALDNLLLTQGWRRFVWKEIMSDKKPPRPFALEQTLSIGGQVVRPNDKPAGVSQLTIFQSGPDKGMALANTDADGSFVVGGFTGKDTARVVVQARKEKGGSNLLIKLHSRWPAVTALTWPLPAEPQPAVVAYLEQSKKQLAAQRQYRADTTKSILLKGVTVEGRKIPKPPTDARRLYARADAVIKPDDVPGSSSFQSVLQLLQGRVAGVTVGPGPDYRVGIRGNSVGIIRDSDGPLFILDGIPIDVTAINSIPVMDVESLEVLKGPSAAIYGSRGGNGVIAIFTKRGNTNYDYSKAPAPGIVTAVLPAYYQAREFYAPRYEGAAKPAQQRPDYRSTTLYWAPLLRTDAAGRAQVSFYSSDDASTFRVAVEGLANTGTPGTGTGEFKVGK